MPVKRNCKDCGEPMLAYSTVQNRCGNCMLKRQKPRTVTYTRPAVRKPLKRSTKPIKKKGKATLIYEKWRDTVAKPYLDKTFGINCSRCGAPPPVNEETGKVLRHEVDHIKTRGARHDLKMVLSNVRYLCWECHRLVTDGKA